MDKDLWKKNKLKYYRKLNNYTQEQIANIFKISQQNYQRYEKGLVEPSIALAIKFADFYSISVKELCGLEEK